MLIARAAAHLRFLLILCLLALPGAPIAAAQDEPAAPAAPESPDAISIDAKPFGVGNVVRRGEWAGIRLVVTDSATRPRGVALRFHMRDDDGDTELAERRVILNPNRQEGVWLYVRLPWQVSQQSVFTVTAHELVETGGDVGQPVVGRQLGATRIQPSQVQDADADLFGVIGRRSLGLSQYENAAAQIGTTGRLEISHEEIHVVAGLKPEELPDYWEGLAQFSVIVWDEGEPSKLGSDLRPEAIREWVRRGGHLVIVLPPVGGEWFAAENPLADLLPEATVERKEGVNLEPYRRLLVSPELTDVVLPTNATIHVFDVKPDTPPADATPVIDGVDGTVVARRIVGTGMVTVVGIDLGSRALSRVGLPRADRFWNRILGKRFETPSPTKIKELGNSAFTVRSFSQTHYADQYFNLEIAKTSAAGIGVLLALIVFIAYWIVAGPGGFALLKMRALEQHSWVWFAASIVVFAAAAWIGANAIRETKISGKHLTFLDHVYGQPVQHTGTWTSVLLPKYGNETLLLDTPELADRRQDIAVWSDSNGQATRMSFPDARSYVVDVRSPQKITVPSRATIKQFKLDWEGPKQWGTPIPVGPGWEPRLGAKGEITGRLVHNLPAALEDVVILVNHGQISPAKLPRNAQAPLLWDVQYTALGAAWEPGEVIDLSLEFEKGGRDVAEYLKNLVPPGGSDLSRLASPAPTVINPVQSLNDYRRLALYSLLTPPRYGESFSGVNRPPIVRRRDAHVWDLGKWFTQPCVVIIGQIPDGTSPTPLNFKQGDTWQRIPMEGRTIVRWVYLLDPRPPLFSYDPGAPERSSDSASDSAGAT